MQNSKAKNIILNTIATSYKNEKFISYGRIRKILKAKKDIVFIANDMKDFCGEESNGLKLDLEFLDLAYNDESITAKFLREVHLD